MLGKLCRRHFEMFSFLQIVGFDISPMEKICMECQSLFSGENTKLPSGLSYAEFA